MKRLHHTLPFLTLLGLPLSAHEGHPHVPPALYADKLAFAPRPLPDRIVLTWRGDPATTQAVTWRTDTTIIRCVAEFAVANEAGRTLKGESVPARTEPLTTDLSEAHYHSAEFTGLTPETLYAYRVGDGVNWSEWFHFRTASRDAKKFTFVYFGDAQNDVRTHWSRVFREAFREAPRAAFTLHAGDLINNAHRDGQWGEWHGAAAAAARSPAAAAPAGAPGQPDGCATGSDAPPPPPPARPPPNGGQDAPGPGPAARQAGPLWWPKENAVPPANRSCSRSGHRGPRRAKTASSARSAPEPARGRAPRRDRHPERSGLRLPHPRTRLPCQLPWG